MDESTIFFLKRLWRGGRYANFWTLPDRRSHWMRAESPDLTMQLDTAFGTYFGVHPCRLIPPVNGHGEVAEPENVRSRIEFITCTNCIFAEFDARNGESKTSVLQRVERLKLKPSVLIDSGGGYHAYWILKETNVLDDDAQRQRAARLQARWVEWVGADTAAKDLARVLRVPGSINHKYPDAPAVTFVYAEYAREYNLDTLRRLLPPPQTHVQNRAAPPATPSEQLTEALLKKALDQPNRNQAGFWLACQLRDNRYAVETAEAVMQEFVDRTPRKQHPYPFREAKASLQQAYLKTPREPLTQRGQA